MSSRKQKVNTDLVTIYQGLLEFADLHVSREDYWPFRAQAIACLWDTILFSGNKYLLRSLRSSMRNLAGISIKNRDSVKAQ